MLGSPGSPALAPDKVEPIRTCGRVVSRGSIGSKFVAKYILLMGHSIESGLNSVVVLRKSILTLFTKADDWLAMPFCILI